MYNDYYTTSTNMANASAITGVLFIGMMTFSIVLSLIYVISFWKIFKKAGKPGWASIVPIYNIIVMLKIAEMPTWNIVLFLIPFANIYIMFKLYIEFAKKMGKSTAFGLGLIFIPIIFVPLLAFADNKTEEKNSSSNTENSFDATSIINAGTEPSNDLNLQNNLNIESTNFEVSNGLEIPTEPVIEPTINIVEPVIEPTPVEIPTEPVIEPTINIVEPVIEPTPVEIPTEPVIEPTINIVEPVIESTPVEIPTEPVIEPTINIVEPVIEPTSVEIPTEPVIEPTINIVDPVIEPTSVEIDTALESNNDSTKKVCKLCGNILPDIVSICPNCGTENE